MTCSARLPVYALIIAAFIPARDALPGHRAPGALVMFVLYLSGILAASLRARHSAETKGGGRRRFMMELPKYQMPLLKDVAIGLWQRAMIFLKRAGTIILGTTIILWALASFLAGEARREASRRFRLPARSEPRSRSS